MSDIRALNGPYRVMAPAIQAGFTTRLKTEQAIIRKLVIRMDTMRRTSYVSAGYLIAEVTAVMLMVVLVITDLGAMAPSLVLVGLISYLLVYLVSLIRDLDNPFEYADGTPGCGRREPRRAGAQRGPAAGPAGRARPGPSDPQRRRAGRREQRRGGHGCRGRRRTDGAARLTRASDLCRDRPFRAALIRRGGP